MPTSLATETVRIGGKELQMGGKYMGHLKSANHLLGDMPALRNQIKRDGYLLLRNFHPRENVKEARRVFLEFLEAKAAGPASVKPKGLKQTQTLGKHPAFKNVLEAPKLMQFFDEFFGKKSLTFTNKWIRSVSPGNNTGAHFDRVYMGRGSQALHTCWTPLGDLKINNGTLAVLEGSHRLESYRDVRESYGQRDVEKNQSGWYSRDPVEVVDQLGGRWLTSDFEMGDIIIFGMLFMHGSTDNTSDQIRLSCDTRYQPASDPVDERWM